LTIKLTPLVVSARTPECAHERAARASSPFHFCSYSSRTCGLSRRLFLAETRRANASLIQLSKNLFSAPGGVSRFLGTPACYSRQKTKNPASSAGSIRHSLPGEFTRCSTAFYPVFVSDLTADLRQIRWPPVLPGRRRAICEYSRFPGRVKRPVAPFSLRLCKIHTPVEFASPGNLGYCS